MKVIVTDQALASIESSFDFLFLQGISQQKITSIFVKILLKAESLGQTPYIGQKEESISEQKEKSIEEL